MSIHSPYERRYGFESNWFVRELLYETFKKSILLFYVWGEYYIAGWKSLEFHLKDFSVPEKIYIVNRTLSKKIKVWGYEIIFKTLAGKYQGKKINLYNKLTPMVKSVCVEDVSLKIACLELALSWSGTCKW